MSTPAKWSWNSSNIDASAEATKAAYQALISNGATRNFSAVVWNDIVNKIVEQRQALGDTDWSRLGLTKEQTYMTPGNQMTADRFNTCVYSMPPIHPWGWEATLGRKEIYKGDICYGAYFIYLIDGLNHWIDLMPLSFNVSIPIHTTLDPNVLVRRALHIINSQNIKWYCTAKSVVDRVLSTKARLKFKTDIHLNLPIYNVQHIMLPLFYNLRMNNKTIVTDSAPIVADIPVQLDITGRITFGDVVFLICLVDGQSDLRGTLSIPPSVRVLIDNTAELTGRGSVTVSVPQDLAASILGQFTGEAWIREPDSIAVKENLEVVQSGSLNFTYSEILRVIANLDMNLSHLSAVTVSDRLNVLADLGIELEHQAKVRGNEATQLKGELIAEHAMQAMMYRKRLTTHGGDLTMELVTSATAAFAPLELYTGADLTMLSEMSATATFARRELYTGADFIMESIMNAHAELQSNKLPMSVSLYDTFSSSAKAAVNPNIMATGVSLVDTFAEPTVKITIIPGNALPFGADLADTTAMSATISTSDNRLYAKGGITAENTGLSTVQLIGAVEIVGGASSEFSGEAAFDKKYTAPIRSNIQLYHFGTATITTQRYVLASEIDDELVSDLDNTLVINVEFQY